MRLASPLLLPAVPLFALASPALAHEGHDHANVIAGLMHPVAGLDHLLVTLGVGLVIGLASRGGASLRVTAAGLSGLLAGLLAAVLVSRLFSAAPAFGALAEPAAVLGLLALAVIIPRVEGLGRPALGLAIGLISLPHALLHLREGSGVAFFAGLALTSLLLLAAGVAAGRLLSMASSSAGARAARALRLALAGGFGLTGLTFLGLFA